MGSSLGLWYGKTQLYAVRFSRVVQKAVYNGPDYLYTQKEVYGTGTLSPTTTNFSGGLSQGQSENALSFDRDYIREIQNPRQRLRIGVGIDDSVDTNVIDSVSPADDPTEGDATDVQNGPEPIYFDLVSCWGQKTAVAEFGFRWSVVDTGQSSSPPPLISNRWDQFQEYGPDQRLVITTVGRAIFRRDALLMNGTVADDYRVWLFVPLQTGFARTLKVGLAQDGLTVNYTLIDRQQTYDANDVGVAHMDVRATAVSVKPNRIDMGFKTAAWGLDVLERRTRHLQGVAERAARIATAPLSPAAAAEAAAGAPFDVGLGAIGFAKTWLGAAELAFSWLPRTTVRVEVVIQGTPTSVMSNLVNIALETLAAKAVQLKATGAGTTASVQADYGARTLIAYKEYDIAPAAGLFNLGNNDLANATDFPTQAIATVVNTEAIPYVYNTNISKGPGQNTGDSELLGVSGPAPALLSLVSAALQKPLEDPSDQQKAPPTAPGITQSETSFKSDPSE